MTLEDQIRAIVDAAVKDALAKLKPAAEHVTVAEYARRWSLSASTVRQAIADERLAVTRIGRAVRIAPDAKISKRAPVVSANERTRLVMLGGGKVGR